ncbi:hypothetical protein DYBT9275_01549 [Dyadobacter sp. CECT 9275]|uniref:DinB family protein n=1 Tax=Dyadobacter helix TaxID=2822344 RepID=A0A916JA98_9BACT|nr:DinB family protein [Dyadobacter sp. CECT 9275]CAG4995102.1 hypothetical protein DYBT9275_01549 [Dyadobacter sp. CECT 9275]
MEIEKSDRLTALVALYDMQTTFFNNALEGISEIDSHKRLDTKANHVAWLTGSLVEQRFWLVRELGDTEQKQEADTLFRDNRGIQDEITYPSLEVFKKDWKAITPVLRDALAQVTDQQLENKIEMGPGQAFSLFDMITFLIYREANCIGQIALWRRLLGYPPMKYM